VTEHATIEKLDPQVTGTAEEERKRAADEALIAEELLVEEVSIDGMCGVY
jgi:mycofactocin precursor